MRMRVRVSMHVRWAAITDYVVLAKNIYYSRLAEWNL